MTAFVPFEELPDEVLLLGYCEGDQELTVAFVRRFQSKVYGIAMAVLRDPAAAEDVAQQAFERAWRHGSLHDPLRGSVGAWLGTITRNLAIDAVRVRRPSPVDTEVLMARIGAGPSHETPEQAALAGESAEQVRAAIRRLPAEQARAVVLAGVAGLTAAQVAESEGVPLGTAKSRIRLGLERLRTTLGHREVDRA